MNNFCYYFLILVLLIFVFKNLKKIDKFSSIRNCKSDNSDAVNLHKKLFTLSSINTIKNSSWKSYSFKNITDNTPVNLRFNSPVIDGLKVDNTYLINHSTREINCIKN